MPVSVSLLDLVAMPDVMFLWPEDFTGLINKLDEAPEDHNQIIVIAGWLEDHGEPDLSAAFKYVAKRPEVQLVKKVTSYSTTWRLEGLHYRITSFPVKRSDCSTPAGPFAELARQLEAARKDLE